MLGTTEMIFIGIALFLLFGGAIFKRGAKQIVSAKKEVKKTLNELDDDKQKPKQSTIATQQ